MPSAEQLPSPEKSPNPEQATREVLEQWLKAKADLLAGGNDQATLSKLASAKLVNNVVDNRAADASQGLSQRVSAKIEKFNVVSNSPIRLEAQVEILYSEDLLDAKGKALKQDAAISLNNTYVFVRPDPKQAWQLADFRSSN